MSNRKSKTDNKKKIMNAKLATEYDYYQNKEEDISPEEVVAYYQNNNAYGKRRTSKRKTLKKRVKKVNRKRRTSKTKYQKHSFGSSELNANFKRYLIIAILLLARSVIKQNPKSINYDISNIGYGALNYLTITSLIELIGYLFGAHVRDKVVLGYIVLSIGLDMSDLI